MRPVTTGARPARPGVCLLHGSDELRGAFLRDLPLKVVLEQLWPIVVIGVVTLAMARWLFRRRLT